MVGSSSVRQSSRLKSKPLDLPSGPFHENLCDEDEWLVDDSDDDDHRCGHRVGKVPKEKVFTGAREVNHAVGINSFGFGFKAQSRLLLKGSEVKHRLGRASFELLECSTSPWVLTLNLPPV